jgi:predicted Rossmann-fold nucleotide-binding protein
LDRFKSWRDYKNYNSGPTHTCALAAERDNRLTTRTAQIVQKTAYEVGKEVVPAGEVLVCGGLGGVMESACRGAKENGGTTVGITAAEVILTANKHK